MISIAIFNNKGGVGKTTFICNLASYLNIKNDKKVLVVDADPQCNASIYVTLERDLEITYSNSKAKTIYDIIKPLQRGSDYIERSNIPIQRNEFFGFDMILGDTRLALAEDFLSSDWIDGQSGNPRGLKTTFFIKDLLYKLEDEYDYIFFDVGPSLGAINRCVLLSCDYFIIPMSSDIFSLKAVDNISESLKKWKQFVDDGLMRYQKSNDNEEYMIGNRKIKVDLKFLGYIYQQYVAKTNKDGIKRPVNAYEKIIKKINKTISSNLEEFYVPALKEDDLLIGEVPVLNSLIPLSQIAHKPIFSLTSTDGVVGAHFSKVKEYEKVIRDIVKRITTNLNFYDLA